MNTAVYRNISKIIERDSKSTTYKYALLRGVIDIIRDNSPYIAVEKDFVHFPLGLLIEKWMLYYFPILESPVNLPQINGNAKLAFENQYKRIIEAYSTMNGFSGFYNDLKNKGIPDYLQNDFLEVAKQLKNTITRMPMKYIGRSISNDFYSIFNYTNNPVRIAPDEKINLQYLIRNYGTFSIPRDYYEAFRVLGSFISGEDSILFKWAEFSVKASRQDLPFEQVISSVLRNPVTLRDTKKTRDLYLKMLERESEVFCVWTGTKLEKYEVDHIIPFAIWKNNDLWNMLPSNPKINNRKRDKIPSPGLIERQKDMILEYWTMINNFYPDRFKNEIQVTLLGNNPIESWPQTGITQLKNSCHYLIATRGYEEWKI